MENQNQNQKPLLIIDTQRYVTQKQYCENKNISPQSLQNMITRSQIKVLHIKEFGLTLIDTQADDKASVELELPKAILSKEQIGEFLMARTIEVATALKEKDCVIAKQSCELTKQSKVITQSTEHIEALTDQNRDLAKYCDDLQQELEKNACLITKQSCELTKQSEVITQNNLEITQLRGDLAALSAKNMEMETEIAALRATNANLTEKLELAKEKALFQADKIQILNQELNTGLMSKLVELVKGKQATEQVNEQAEVKPQYFVVLAKNNQSSNQLQEAISELMKSYKNIMIDDVEDFFITVRTEVDKLNMQSSCKEEFVKLTEFPAEDLHTITIGEKFQLTIRKVCKSL